MKKCIAIVTTLLLLLPLTALADSTLTVQGSATVSIKPDTATLNVGFSGESKESSKIQQTAADTIEKVVAAIKAMDIDEEDIVTAYINTYPTYDYTTEGESLRGFRVEHVLAVTVRDMDKAGDVLDAALEAGANYAASISYSSSKSKDAYLQALALAVEDASAKADALAIASGLWLGSLEAVNELGGTAYPLQAKYAASTASYDMAGGASMGSSIMTGNLDVSASVELVYEVR